MRCDNFSTFEKVIFKITRSWMSDKRYAEWMLRRYVGKGNIDNPQTFNQKIQWLKLYDRNPLYPQLADKYAVRDYVSQKIGKDYLNEIYGVYDSPDEIEFSALPESFIIKATHGSGMNIIVKNKNEHDLDRLSKQLKAWLRTSYTEKGREWVYKDIKPKIICEKLLIDACGRVPDDYKIFCFNGIPKIIEVDCDRFTNHTSPFYDTEWRKMPFGILYTVPDKEIVRPENLDKMLSAASKLSVGLTFVRVDFYAIPKIVFGEMTFYPGNGFEPFIPSDWDLKVGRLMKLPAF